MVCWAHCTILLLVWSGSFYLPVSWRVGWFFQGRPWETETKKEKRNRVRKRESLRWWKWQWHWAYCLVKHTPLLPHAAWSSNRGQWNLLIGSAVTEPKQSHSAAVIRRKWADLSYSRVRPCEVPATSLLQLRWLWHRGWEFMLLRRETQTDVTCNFTWNERKLCFYRVRLFPACLKSNPC